MRKTSIIIAHCGRACFSVRRFRLLDNNKPKDKTYGFDTEVIADNRMKNSETEYEKIIWMLDQRFDFLLPWFEKHYNISLKNVLFVGSYHGTARYGYNTKTLGNISKNHVVFLEPEDINRIYAKELNPDEKTLIVPFTGAYLPSAKNLSAPFSTGEIAIHANNKRWQSLFFQEINIPAPKTWCLNSASQLTEQVKTLLKTYDKLVVKKAESSGGNQMYSITSIAQLLSKQIPNDPRGEVLISEYLSHKQSFAGMGVIRKDGQIIWCGATEQVLYHDYAYEGLIWPPYLTESSLTRIENMTRTVGRELAKTGYFGFYNVDYVLSSGELYAVEINARFGFGTLLFALSCGANFWQAVTDGPTHTCQAPGRLILGKIKGRAGRRYTGLSSCSNILHWFQNGNGEFRTLFCGTEGFETFDYGSFIGLFGAFLPCGTVREETLQLFWNKCLQEFK